MSQVAEVATDIFLFFYYWLEAIVLYFVPRHFRFKNITEDIVLVTGGGSGIGRKVAQRFAARGAVVVLWDVNEQGNEETAEMINDEGGKAWAYKCDIADRQEVYRMANKVRREVGVVTIVINNAGIVNGKNLMEIPDHMIVKTLEVNVISHFWILKAFLADMKAENRGHIVSISSLGGLVGIAKLTDYCASKFAVVGLQEAVEMELRAEGQNNIFFTTVCPYFINTGLFKGAGTSVFANLEPDYVADEILAAVLCNQRILLLPRLFYTLHILKTIIPAQVSVKLNHLLGGDQSMAHFTGRELKT